MTDTRLQDLHDSLTDELLDRLKNGDEQLVKVKTEAGEEIARHRIRAAAATLNVARQWLNDNHVAADPARNEKLQALRKELNKLPFGDDDGPIN